MKCLLILLVLLLTGCRAELPAPELTLPELTLPEPEPVPEAPAAPESEPLPEEPALPWNLILVNAWNPVPEDYAVTLTLLRNSQAIDQRAYPDLQEMMDAARAQGLNPLICSSWRTTEKQRQLYANQVRKYRAQGFSEAAALQEAAKWVAPPGTSEHQTGLAVDIVSADYQLLDEGQEQTPEQRWLMAHCWEYGFILRYPPDKSQITGISYEPWHYRWVGREAALAIRDSGLCLEEWLEQLKKAEGGSPLLVKQ